MPSNACAECRRRIPILVSLLESILGFEIHGLQLMNPIMDKGHASDKLAVLDIKAQDQAGRLYNIEIQMVAYRELIPRFLYYWSKLYASQLVEGDEYGKLCPTISVFLVNDTVIAETEAYHHPVHLQNVRTNQRFSNHLELHLIEIPKFRKSLAELAEPLDQWLYFFKHAEELDPVASPSELKVRGISQAFKELYKMAQSSLEREVYEARLKAQRDELTLRKSLERVEAEARARRAEAEAAQAAAQAAQAAAQAAQAEAQAAQAEAREVRERLEAETRVHQKKLREYQTDVSEQIAELNKKLDLIVAINQKQFIKQLPMSSVQDLKPLSIEELQQQLKELD
jgi:predicted transposase/invertase (TIGR01784 family)